MSMRDVKKALNFLNNKKNAKSNRRNRNNRRPKSMDAPRPSASMSQASSAKKRRNRRNRRKAPAAVSGSVDRFPRGVPQKKNGRDYQCYEEDEYIGEITVANFPNFNIAQTLPINPGQATTFPWLSNIAKQFEMYRFVYLHFYYKPEVTQYSANGIGKVIMSIDYDAADPPPANKQQMEDTNPHCDAMPYQSLNLKTDCRKMFTMTDAKFVRPGGVPGQSDVKTYDAGNLYVATQGQAANTIVGELRVKYKVELMTPVLENLVGIPANNSVSAFQTSTPQALTTTVSANLLAPTIMTNGLQIVNTAGAFVIPPGNYIADFAAEFVGSTNNITSCQIVTQKNNVSVSVGTPTFQGTVTQGITLNQNLFLTSNGTDVYTFVATAVFGSGTAAVYGQIRFTAI